MTAASPSAGPSDGSPTASDPSGEVLVVLSSANRRGAELQGSALASELAARGMPARAVALAPSSSTQARVDVAVLGSSALSPRTLAELRRVQRGARVVIGYGSRSLPACTLVLAGARTPFIYRSIGDPAAWVRGRLHRGRTGLQFRRAEYVAALFPRAADSIESLYRVPSDRIATIPNARNAETFAPPSDAQRAAARRHFGIDGDRPVVAFVGSLSHEKRPDLMVDVASRLPDAMFLVAGDGPLRSELDAAIARLDDPSRVRRLGALDDVREVLTASDAVLITSATEGMPGAVIEAALMGVPCVATDVGAVRDVVGRGGRVLPADSDAGALADGLDHVLADRAGLGALARQHADDRFSWDAVIPQWLALIERAAQPR